MDISLKRILSFVLALVLVVGLLPSNLFAIKTSAAEADGWYWDGTTLYIKDGSITGANFIKAVQEKTGSTISTVYYSTADLKTPAIFRTSGTQISKDTTYTSFARNTTYYASTYSRSGLSVSGTVTGAFTVEYYYTPTITETNNPTSDKATVTSKVIYGNNATVTLPQMTESGWVATVSAGTDSASQISAQTVKLSTTGTTTVTVGPINSTADATIRVEYVKATSYNITVSVADECDGWGTASASATSSIAGETIAITATPTENTASTTYAYSKITVNGVEQTGLTFTMPEGKVEVEVYFTKTDIHMNADPNAVKIPFNGYYTGANADGFDLDALKKAIFETLEVGSLPAGATWENVTIQYFPLKVGKISGNSEYDSTCYDLNYSKADEEIFGIGYEYRDFGERLHNGEANVKEKVRITYEGLYIEAEITLTESRPETTISFDTSKVECYASLDEFKAAVEAAITATNNAVFTVEFADQESDDNWAGNYTVTVSVAGTADYQAASATYTVEAKVHNYVAGEKVDATCTADAYTPYTCSGCGDTYNSVEVGSAGHKTEVKYEGDTAVCGGTYYKITYCTVCSVEISRETITNADHSYVNKQSEKAATCTEAGEIVWACACGATQTETVAATGHGTNGYTYSDLGNGKHKKICSDCNATVETVEHSYDSTTHKCVCGNEDTNKNGVYDGKETVYVMIGGDGSVTIDGTVVANGGKYIYDSTKGSYTIVATPADLNGSDGNAGYVSDVKGVNGASSADGAQSITGTYSAGVYTGSASYSVLYVTFDTRALDLNTNPVLKVNGYNWSTTADNLKNELIKAALKTVGGASTDYTVWIWADYLLSEGYQDLDNDFWNSFIGAWVQIPGTEDVKIQWNASSDGKYIAISQDGITVTVEESRTAATVTPPSALSGTFDTEEAFLDALKAATIAYDNNNEKITEDVLTLNASWDGNECTVTWEITADGATWLKASGTLGTYTWNISVYEIVFVNDDGTELYRWNFEYGSTPEYKGTAVEELAAAKNDAQYTYTFAGWSPEINTVTGVATYTATYTATVNKYTITFVDGSGNVLQTEEVEYGTVPTYTSATPTKASTNTLNFTFKGWDVEIVAVTGPATYTAQFEASTRYYTVTFKDYNGTVLGTSTVEYGQAATAPAAPTRAADMTYTYAFAGWDKAFDSITADGVVITATYTPTYIDYTINWVVPGVNGNATTPVTYHYGDTIVYFGDAADWTDGEKNYYFSGWDYNGDGEFSVGETMPATVTGNATFTAVFSNKTLFDVTVVYGNGTADATGKIEDGNTYTIPADPARSGYRFMGWVDQNGNVVSGTITITENTTITAQWAELFIVTWMNDGKVYKTETDAYIAGETPAAPTDPTKDADAQYTYTFAGWTPSINAITGDTTYNAVYTMTVNQYTVTFTDENGNVLDKQTLDYGATPVYGGTTPSKQYYSWAWDKTIATVTGNATYKLVWTPINDTNNNGIADELETATVTVIITGNGTVTLTPAGNAELINQEGNVYTYLYDSTDAANKVINVTATPNDTNATDGNVDYLISAPATVNVGETVTAEFGTYTLNASNGAFTMNGYYESHMNMDEIIKTLKADVLNAAGLDGANASNYTVKMKYSLGELDLDKLTGWTNALNATAFFTAIELPESGRQFTITDNSTGVSKTVTMKITDSRPSAGLKDTEVTDVKVLDDEQGLTDYVTGLANGTIVNPNGLTVSVALTEGSWPPAAAGETTKLVYTVTYADSADYIGGTATLTVYVQSAYNNCTVIAGSIGGGTLTVSPSNDNKTVAGNDTISVTITPASDYAVETITVYNQTTGEYVEVSAITYSDKAGTVTFKSDGSLYADQYVVSATYSKIELSLNADQTIVYCVDDKNHTYDLQAMVFDAIYGGFNIDLTKGDVTLEFKYGTIIVDLWADVSGDPAINLNGISHKFGESGLETIRFTYEDEKYGKVQQTIDLNVFDSCYNNTVGVQTIAPEGTKHDFSVKYSEDAREYLGVKYYKQGTTLTVRLTPAGDDILAMLEQMYNKTYADNYPYIKSVTVYKNVDGNWVEVESTLERVNGELLQGENPLAYCAAVTFTMDHDTQYKIVAEYDILKLNRVSENKFQMEMYQAGKGYEAKVPSAQDFINKILGEEAAAEFLATYGGSYKVEFSSDLITYNWTEVTDEALLALNDGTEIVVRITWNPADDNKTYYPMSVTAEPTLVDLRTATSVEGTVPTEPVEYVEEEQLIANLKEAMGLAIITANGQIDVEYDVNYTITVSEVNGNYATVIVTYHGSTEYKPSTKTFENVPVADIPDNATIKVTIQNASDRITNNAGTIMSLDPSTGIYTVIGNGTYNFQFTPVTGKAIEAVTVNGVAVELTYSNGVATFSMYLNEKVHYEVVVETVDSVWVLEDERLYDFANGIDTPDNGDIADAATKAPTEIDFDQVEMEYLARAEGTVTITLPSFTILGQNVELGTFDVELGELWLNPEEATELVSEDQLDKLLEQLLEDLQDEILSGNVALTDALDYVTNYVKTLPLGIHAFGANGDGSVETVRFSYADDKYTLAQVVTDVTIHDYRTPTKLEIPEEKLEAGISVTYGYSLADLIEAAGVYIMAQSDVATASIDEETVYVLVDGLKIETDHLYLTVGEHEITLFFAGDATYQPCEITFTVTVNKAVVDIDYDSQFITYGDEYEFGISIAPTYHNDGTVVDPDMVEFMIGLDMHTLLDLDIEDKTVGIDQAIGTIYIRLPKSVREILTSDLAQALGITALLESEMSLSQLSELINTASSLLGIDEDSVDTLNQVITAITGITDSVDVKVKIVNDDFHPTNIGVYIAGAVTIEENYETAYTADYLIIAPKTYESELEWDYTDSNGIMTLPAYQEFYQNYMGAHVVENEVMTGDILDTANGHIKYLILGVNDETSEFLTTDIYGNIQANIWTSNDAITDNGVYVQIAYMLNWGNEIYYAMPIVRTFIIAPEIVDVELRDDNNQANNDLWMEFDNTGKGFHVYITDADGNLILNTYNGDASEWLTVTYVGIQTNGKLYNSTEKPVHAGVYTVTALYVEYDEDGNLLRAGMDAGVLVIEPTDSTVEVEDVIVVVDPEQSYNPADQVIAGSTVESLIPDTTIITAGIASNGSFTTNGWDAVNGTANVDFPKWMDELLAQYAPDVMTAGITVGTLIEKLNEKLPVLTAELTELGATEEIINSLTNAVNNVVKALEQLPADVQLTFQDDITYTNVGAYVIIAVVTDSDHYPSVDAGLLVITPDFTEVELKWNYVDENGVFTRDLLEFIDYDLWAKAFGIESGVEIEEATKKITYQFIGINSDGDLVVYTDADELPNGAYIELAYIEFELDGIIYISDMIARPVVIIASNCNVEIENLETVFDNTNKDVNVNIFDLDGVELDQTKGTLTILYTGLQTNGKTYLSSEAPVHAGVYQVLVTYVEYDENGELRYYGASAGYVIINPADSSIDVTGDTVVYDGEGHTANVTVTGGSSASVDFTLISGGVWFSADVESVGLDAFHGNVNIDFPKWFDAVLAGYEFADGVDTAYLIDFITSYRDELVAAVPAEELIALGVAEEEVNAFIDKINAYIDELLAVLEQLPEDVTLTFVDDITYTEPGYYFYYGIVTDSDHIPSTDTGLLVIEKMDSKFGAWHEVVTYDGNEHMVFVPNDTYGPVKYDYFMMILDRENNHINFVLDEDLMYILSAVETLLDIELPEEISVEDLNAILAAAGLSMDDFADAIIYVLDAVLADMEIPTDPIEYSGSTYRDLLVIRNLLSTLPEDGTITINGELPVNVGTYEFYLYGYSQYYESVDASAFLFIEPIRIVIDAEDAEKVYGATDPELEAILKFYGYEGREDVYNWRDYVGKEGYFVGWDADVQNDTLDKIVYQEIEIDINDLPEGFWDNVVIEISREAGENVGEYEITVDAVSSSDNFVIESVTGATFTITPADLTITLEDLEKTYGDADPEFTFNIEGLVNGDTAEDLNIVISREEGENVGEYIITATAANGNYNITIVDATLTINKAIVSVDVNNATKVYGDADPTFTATVSGLKFEDKLDITFNRVAGENVGQYVITATASDDNYIIIFATGLLTIEKANVTVTVDNVSKVYGDADPTFTAQVEGLKFNDKLNITFTRTEGEDVGTYVITAYAEDANYNITFVSGTLTIAKAIVSVDVNNVSKVYGEADPTFTATVSGLIGEDTLDITFNRVAGENVGQYVITAYAENDNYTIIFATGLLTIEKANVTVTVDDASKIYGEADPTFTAQVEGLKFNDTLDITFTRTEGENVGTYTITAYAVDANYNITFVSGTLTINKAIVSVDVNNVSKVYGEADPTFTATVSGLIGEDTLDITFNRVAGENVGQYVITAYAENDNYTIIFATGLLTITAKELNSSNVALDGSLTYDGTEQTQNIVVVYDPAAVIALDGNTILIEGTDYIVTGNTGKNAGTYTLTITGTGNYTGSVEVEWTINKKDATITAIDKSMIAGNPITLDAIVSGVVDGDTLNYTLFVDTDGKTGGSIYTIQVILGENPNYNITTHSGSLTVSVAVVSVNGIYYGSWISAMEAHDTTAGNKDYNLKDAEIVLYADIYDDGDFEHRFNGNMKLNLNGCNFYTKKAVTVFGTTEIYGGGSFDVGTDGWPLVIGGNVILDSSVAFSGTLQFNTGSKGNLIIGDEYALGNTGKYNTSGSEAYVRIVFKQGLQVLDFQNGQVTLTKNDGTLEHQNITIGQSATFTIAEGVTLTLDPTTTVTINGTVNGEGTIKVGTKVHLDQVLTQTQITNIEIAEGIVIDEYTLDRADVYYTGAQNLIGTGVVITAGTFDANVYDNCAAGYYAKDNGNGTWTVLPKIQIDRVEISDNLIYNGNAQTPSNITVYDVNGNKVDSANYEVIVEAQINAGTYTLTVKALDANVAWIGEASAEWTIAKATIVITGNNATITYGEKTPEMTYTVTVNNGMDLDRAFAEVLTFIAYDAAEVASVGQYGTKFGYNIDGFKNWSITVVGGALTVVKRNVTVTVGPDMDICVGGAMPEFTITIDNAYNNEVIATVNTDNVKLNEFGTYTVTAEVVYDENNYNVEIITATLTISKHIEVETTINEVKPTCSGEGSYTIIVTCACCGEELDRETITVPATGHTAGDAVQENYVAPTFDTVGSYDLVTCCSVCGAELSRETVEVPKLIAVASVNGVRYETVQAAINAASAGDTVLLLANVTENVTVSKSITIDGDHWQFTGNISVSGNTTEVTVKNVDFVNGTGYAITTNRIKSITVENCTVKNYAFGFLYANKSTPTVVVKDVTVKDCTYGVHWVYGTTATLENVTMTDVTYGLCIQNYADKTINLTNCDISSITIWERDGQSGVQTFKFYGDNTAGTLSTSQYAKFVLAEANATLTAPENFPVESGVDTHLVKYEDGKYFLVERAFVAQVGDKKFETIQAAINAAQDGDTIVILRDHEIGATVQNEKGYNYESVIIVDGKSVTIDFAGHTVTVKHGEAANYAGGVANCLEAVVFIYSNAGLTLMDSTGDNGGFYVPADENVSIYSMFYNCGGKLTINSGVYNIEKGHGAASVIYAEAAHETAVTGGNFTMGNAGENSNTKPWIFNTEGKNKTFVLISGGTYNQNPYMNYGTQKDCEAKLVEGYCIKDNGNGTWTVVKHIADEAKQENYVAPTFDAVGSYDLVIRCTICGEILSSEHHEIAKLIAVASVNGVRYETVQAAINAASAGDTVLLLANVTENVTVSKSITIDGDHWQFTGNISVSGNTTAVTVKNVDFVNGTGYAITTNRIKSITVENCTVKNYAFGFLYANKSTPTVVVKDVTVKDCTYGVHWVYGTTATLENVTMTGVTYGLCIQNYASKTINLTNCDISSITIWERDGQSGVQTFKFYGDNTAGTLSTSQYAEFVLAEANATLTAPENFPVESGVETHLVKYEDGKYFLTEIVYDYVAKNITTGVSYESLQAAIDAAQSGETIVLLKDLELTTADTVKNSTGYATIFNVAGKAITIDLNGHNITVDAHAADLEDEKSTMLMSVFAADTNGYLTLTGEGKVELNANDATIYSLAIAYDGLLTIEGGTYTADKLPVGRGMIYGNVSDHANADGSNKDKGVNVTGGTFLLENTGDLENESPWIFATAGSNAGRYVWVTGGTFNADISHQYYIFEVEVPETLACKNNGDGTWTIVEAVAYVEEYQYSTYYAKIGYATFAEAYAAAAEGEKITILANILVDFNLTENVVVYKGSNNVTFAEGAAISAGTFDWDVNANCAIGYYAKDNGDGTWTVEKRADVAYNETDGIYYTDVSDALAAAGSGDTVILLVDGQTEAMLVVPAGVTFNLNGHYITAGNVFSFGNVIDNNGETDGLGGIVITNDRTKAFVQLQQTNTYLPLYDAANGCYRFFAYSLSILTYQAESEDAVTFRFRLRLSTAEAYKLLADTENSGVEISANVEIQNNGKTTYLTYVLTGEYLAEYAMDAYNQVISGEKTAMKVNKVFALTLTGLDSLESGAVVTVVPTITTEVGTEREVTGRYDDANVYTMP